MAVPLWRRGVDELDALTAPVVGQLVRSDLFVQSLAVVVRGRLALVHRAEGLSRNFLHALNLPTGSDVNRILAQTAAVERSVRQLTRIVENDKDGVL